MGYLLRKSDTFLLIHSNYLGGRGVEVEFLQDSAVFAPYSRFYLVPLSGNKALLEAWRSNKPIPVLVD